MLRKDKIWSYPELRDPVEFRGKVKVSPKQAQGTRMQSSNVQTLSTFSWPCI